MLKNSIIDFIKWLLTLVLHLPLIAIGLVTITACVKLLLKLVLFTWNLL